MMVDKRELPPAQITRDLGRHLTAHREPHWNTHRALVSSRPLLTSFEASAPCTREPG
jgi:hypothetical protein